ncbi:MAG: glycoside hydrolase family 43 protein [Spirochaetes bacterium]|nr:glycoside hydrolase family 43 protein [Spirochaetota bacterium]
MKLIKSFTLLIISVISCISGCSGKGKPDESRQSEPVQPLITDIYSADPSAHVFNGKIYIYPSHDIDDAEVSDKNGSQYNMKDYHVFSMEKMGTVPKDHGEVLNIKDVRWASQFMWAPDAAFKNGTYYFYFPAHDKKGIFRIGVATSKNPEGPFTPEPSYIPGSFSIDPAVFTDTDGTSYMYFGGLWGGQMEKWTDGRFDAEQKEPYGSSPALGPYVAKMSDDMLTFASKPQMISILDQDGNPITGSDNSRRFFEASWMHKYKDTYYFSYSTGDTHMIVYATSDKPTGPFTYRGIVLLPVTGWTNHHSIVEFEGKWYLFYHDCTLSKGTDHLRNVKVTELFYNSDGTIKTIDPI